MDQAVEQTAWQDDIRYQERQVVYNVPLVLIHLLDQAVEQTELQAHIHLLQDLQVALIVQLVRIQILDHHLEQIEMLEPMLQMLERVHAKYEQQEHILHQEHQHALSDLLAHIKQIEEY